MSDYEEPKAVEMPAEDMLIGRDESEKKRKGRGASGRAPLLTDEPEAEIAPPHPLEGQAVSYGEAIYIVENGRRRLLPDPRAFHEIGLRPVIRLMKEEMEAIPLGRPFPAQR
jgi:hypothetical protein